MRVTTLMTQATTLADLNNAYTRIQTTQAQLASGKRINQPSDDPYGASLAMNLNGALAGLGNYSGNVQDGLAWTQTAGTSLSNMESVLQRTRELVVQGANGTNSQSGLNNIAAEVDQLTASVTQEANTQYAGQYVFAGAASSTAPYGAATGDVYQGDHGTVSRQIGPSTTVPVSLDASTLLGSGQSAADGKLLDVMRTISADLKAGNTTAVGGADLANLDTNMTALQSTASAVGATQNRLQLAATRLQDMQGTTTEQLSGVQDADMAQTITDYSTEQAAYTAALRAGASIVQSSLLDFLK